MDTELTTRTDAELLHAYGFGGAEEAFNELIRRYGPLAYGSALRMLGDPASAEDAAQAAFLALLRKAKTLTAETSVAGWLQRAACLAAQDIRKLQRRRKNHEDHAAQQRPQLTEFRNRDAQLDDVPNRLRGAIDDALALLPAAQRDTVVLRYLAGKSRAEVAAELACSEATVQTRINRARVRLRAILQRQQIVPAIAFAAWKLAIAPGAQPTASGVVAAIRNACFEQLVSTSARQVSRRVLLRLCWESTKLRVACGVAVAALGLWGALALRPVPPKTLVPAPRVAVAAPTPVPARAPIAPPVLAAAPAKEVPAVAVKAMAHEEDDFEVGLRPNLTVEAAQVAIAKPAEPPPPVDLVLNIRESRDARRPARDAAADLHEKVKKIVRQSRSELEQTLFVELTRDNMTSQTTSRFTLGNTSGGISTQNVNLSTPGRP